MGVLRKIKKRLFGITENELISSLRQQGAHIGQKVKIWAPNATVIDQSRPWLLTIGDYTKITSGVIILTHDYSLSTIRRVYGEWIGEGQETIIGDNCFIGMNSILLMGTHLGNNVIVGAGSVVHGSFPDNVVIAGNPAKIICSLEEHYNRRKAKTAQEAVLCAKRYIEVFHKDPEPKDLAGFKFLFAPRDPDVVNEYGLSFFCNGDEPEEVKESFYKSEPTWPDFEAFLKEVHSSSKEVL